MTGWCITVAQKTIRIKAWRPEFHHQNVENYSIQQLSIIFISPVTSKIGVWVNTVTRKCQVRLVSYVYKHVLSPFGIQCLKYVFTAECDRWYSIQVNQNLARLQLFCHSHLMKILFTFWFFLPCLMDWELQWMQVRDGPPYKCWWFG
jgi:hypothetical protein